MLVHSTADDATMACSVARHAAHAAHATRAALPRLAQAWTLIERSPGILETALPPQGRRGAAPAFGDSVSISSTRPSGAISGTVGSPRRQASFVERMEPGWANWDLNFVKRSLLRDGSDGLTYLSGPVRRRESLDNLIGPSGVIPASNLAGRFDYSTRHVHQTRRYRGPADNAVNVHTNSGGSAP